MCPLHLTVSLHTTHLYVFATIADENCSIENLWQRRPHYELSFFQVSFTTSRVLLWINSNVVIEPLSHIDRYASTDVPSRLRVRSARPPLPICHNQPGHFSLRKSLGVINRGPILGRSLVQIGRVKKTSKSIRHIPAHHPRVLSSIL